MALDLIGMNLNLVASGEMETFVVLQIGDQNTLSNSRINHGIDLQINMAFVL